MKKLLATCGPLLVLALLLSGCGVSVTPSAARVDGTTIGIGTLNQTLDDASSSPLFRCLLAQQAAITGAGVHSTLSSRFVAEQLSLLIERAEIERAVGQLGLHPTAIAKTLSAGQIASGLNGQVGGACSATGAMVMASLSVLYRNLLTTLQMDQDLISAHLAGVTLTPAGVAAFSQAHPGVAELACVSAILVAKRSSALSLRAKIVGGTSFALVAKSSSIDTQTAANGGSLGCVYPGQFAPALSRVVASIVPGAPSQPIAFGSNWVLLEVTSRQTGSAAGAALALVTSQTNAETTYANRLNARANVWVNSSYGSWALSSGQYRVVAPAGPSNAEILNPFALTPVGDTYN